MYRKCLLVFLSLFLLILSKLASSYTSIRETPPRAPTSAPACVPDSPRAEAPLQCGAP